MVVEFIKVKEVEAGRLSLWRRGEYLYELEIRKAGVMTWHQWLEDCDLEAAEEEFARIN